jgi:tRNA(fMet)-specific endonuclease VapC
MNGKYLLDTNIVIAIFNQESIVLKKLAETNEVFLPVIVVGELCYGAYKSKHSQKNLEKLEDFINSNVILSCDSETAKIYGRFKNELRQLSKLVPENDIWIASLTKQNNLTLVSRDGHFKYISEIAIEEW